jgi:radical SAM protein with 4Fe4S-binding SPASM domain
LAGSTGRVSFCAAGDQSIGVTPAGWIVPCVLIEEADVLGHVGDDPGKWIEAGRRWLRSRKLRSECQACDHLPMCGGGCPAIMPVCGIGECEFIRRQCDLAVEIYENFEDRPQALLGLVGIT